MQSVYLTAITQGPGLVFQCVGIMGQVSTLVISNWLRPELQSVVKSLIKASTQLHDIHERVSALELEGSRRRYFIRYSEHSDSARVYLKSCTELCHLAESQINQGSLWATLRSMGSFGVYLRASRDMLTKAEESIKLAIPFADWLELSYFYLETAAHTTKLRNILGVDIKPHISWLDEANTKSLIECEKACRAAYHIWCDIGELMTILEDYVDSGEPRPNDDSGEPRPNDDSGEPRPNDDSGEPRPNDCLPSREDVVQLIGESNAACALIETYVLVADKILARSLNPAL